MVDLSNVTITGGTLETKSGGTIETVYGTTTFDDVCVVNNGSIDVDYDTNKTTLTLENGTAITGGDMTIGCSGILAIESCAGASLDNVGVCNLNLINVDSGSNASTLYLTDGTSITGGTLWIGCSGTVDIEGSGTTLDDVNVCNQNIIAVDETSETTTLTLEGGTTIAGGMLVIGCSGALDIETSTGATLDGVDVNDCGIIQVDTALPATLYLIDGTTIDGDGNAGTLLIKGSGTVDVETGGAKFEDLNVTNNNIIEVGETADSIVKLKLDGTFIEGGTLATGGDPYGDGDAYGVIRVVGSDTTTFDGSDNGPVTVSGYVQVAPKADLELTGTIKLDGDVNGLGVIELDQSMNGSHGATLIIDNTVTLKGDGYIALEGDKTGIVGNAKDGGTLINDSYIYGARGGYIGTGDDSLTFTNQGTVVSQAGDAGPLVIDTGGNHVTNTGALEASGYSNTDHSELDLYGTYDNSKGTISATDGGLVEFFGATVNNGALTVDMTVDMSVDPNVDINSEVDIETANGGSTTTTFNNVTVTDDGIIQIDELDTSATLLLTGGTTISGDTGDTDQLLINSDGTVDVETGGATFAGLNVTNDNLIEVGATTASGTILTLEGTTITGGGLAIGATALTTTTAEVNIENGTTTLDGVIVTMTAGSSIVVDVTPATLLVEDGTTITGGALDIGAKGTLDVEAGSDDPAATYSATLDGVTVGPIASGPGKGAGAIDIGVTSTATLLVEDGTTIDGGTLTVGSTTPTIGTLDVEAGGINGEGATLDGVAVTLNGGSGIEVAETTTGSTVTLELTDGTGINGSGTMTIGSSLGGVGEVDIETGSDGAGNGATFDSISVISYALADGIEVGNTTAGAVLTLEGGATITGGTLAIGSASGSGEVHIESTGATLDGVTVTSYAPTDSIVIDTSAATLTVDDDTTIAGGTLTINSKGTLDVETGAGADGSGHGAALDGVGVTNDNNIEVGAGAVLTLGIGTVVTMNSANAEITGTGTLDNCGTIAGFGTIGSGLTLTNESGALINADVSGETLKIEDAIGGAGTVQIQGGTLEFTVAETNVAVTFDNPTA